MKKIIRLTESDLTMIVRRVIEESKGKNLMEQVDPKIEGALKGLYEEVKNTINSDIDSKIKTDPKFPKDKISVRVFTTKDGRTGENVNAYQFLYGTTKFDSGITVLQLINQKWDWVGEQVKGTFDSRKNANLPDVFKQGSMSINIGSIIRTINNWILKNKSTVIPPNK
jgi:hypothetical protein